MLRNSFSVHLFNCILDACFASKATLHYWFMKQLQLLEIKLILMWQRTCGIPLSSVYPNIWFAVVAHIVPALIVHSIWITITLLTHLSFVARQEQKPGVPEDFSIYRCHCLFSYHLVGSSRSYKVHCRSHLPRCRYVSMHDLDCADSMTSVPFTGQM